MIQVIERSNKKLTPLSFSYDKSVSDEDIITFSDGIGKLPYVVINGVTIENTDISFFKLYNNKFLPELEMTFNDPTNRIHDSQYPLDKQIVSILIKANSDFIMPIRMDFYITGFKTTKNKSASDLNQYSLRAILDTPRIIKNYCINGTSYDVLRKISEMTELGFASNINNTNDSMNWINVGVDFVTEFISDVVRHSYMNDNTFLFAYVDFYYNLNYIDVEKQIKNDISDSSSLTNSKFITGEELVLPLILSNHPDKNSTNLFIDKFNLDNDSTRVNFEQGYTPGIIFYNSNDMDIKTVMIDPISTSGDKQDQIVMKGQPDDNEYLVDQDKSYFYGKIDTDNVHENFVYCKMLNEHNLNFLQKIKMSVILKNINYQLYRFQKVNVEIYKMRELDSDPGAVSDAEIKSAKNTDRYKLNTRLSGEWLITAINYTYKKGKNRNFVQEITLVRRELSADADKK